MTKPIALTNDPHQLDQIIHAKWIITCEQTNRTLEDHALLIKDGYIQSILPSDKADELYPNIQTARYKQHAIMPGLINAHTHLPMNLFRGLADDLDLMDWLTNHIWPRESQFVDDDFVYDGSLLAMGEMLRGGTTCFNDMYFFPASTARACEAAGMRGHIGMTIIDVPTKWANNTEEYFAKGLDFHALYKDHPLIQPTLAPHAPYTVSLENLLRVKELADQHRLKITMHIQEAPIEMAESLEKYQTSPLQRLADHGFVSPNLMAIHMTQILPSDFDLLTSLKPSIVHCPESNMKLANGTCPVAKLIELGINVALGTDGAASNNDLDMFGEMKSAGFLGKLTAQDPKALPVETVLKMATINGAKALGIDHITGSLVAGKSADFIAIDLYTIETQPLYNPASQIVNATNRSQVTDVWVKGRQLLKNRQLLTLDENELLRKAEFWRKQLKSGYTAATSAHAQANK